MDSCRSYTSMVSMLVAQRLPAAALSERVRVCRPTTSLPGSTRGRAQPGNGRPAVAYVGAMPRISGVQTTEKLDLSLALSSNGGAAGLVAQWELAEGLEAPVQILYLSALLGFLVVGVYLIVRQVLIRRELEEAAKVLGERLRTGTASPEDCFELGVILLRKKLYTAATKNLERARREWDGEPEELAQIHNALGFAYLQMERLDFAINNFGKAVELQPGYTIAWNNLGDAYERARDYENALKAYEGTLVVAPDNKVAQTRAEALRSRLQRLGS